MGGGGEGGGGDALGGALRRSDESRTSEVDDAEEGEAQDPLYLRLTRKEVRFRDEQMEGCTAWRGVSPKRGAG